MHSCLPGSIWPDEMQFIRHYDSPRGDYSRRTTQKVGVLEFAVSVGRPVASKWPTIDTRFRPFHKEATRRRLPEEYGARALAEGSRARFHVRARTPTSSFFNVRQHVPGTGNIILAGKLPSCEQDLRRHMARSTVVLVAILAGRMSKSKLRYIYEIGTAVLDYSVP